MKKAIITLLSIILIAGLFVACSNEVETPNGAVAVAYTEVLESNGAFKVGDKSYASLQEAVNEAAKTSGTVKLQQDVTGRGAIIPEDKTVTLDLNGKTMVLTDADNGAILLSSGSILTVQNGTLSLVANAGAEAAIFGSVQAKTTAPGDRYLEIAGTAVVDAGEGAAVSGDKLIVGIAEGADVSGNLFVSNGTLISKSDNVKGVLFVENGVYYETANANASLRLAIGEGAVVEVEDSAKVVIVSVPESGDWEIVCSGPEKTAEIIDEAEIPLDPGSFAQGFCYVEMGGARHYTGSLAEAIEWAAGSKTVVYALNHTGTDTETITADAMIDLNGHTEYNDFAINPGVTLTIIGDETDNSVFAGNISESTTEGTGDRNLVVMNAKVTGAITKLTSVRTSGAVIIGTIGSGDSNAVYSVYDGWDDVAGYSTFRNDIYTIGTQVYNNSIFSSDSDLASLADSTAITINNAIGEVGNIRTYNGSILINNANATSLLTTGTLTAWNGEATYHDVIIMGNNENKVVVETIDYAEDVVTSYASLGAIGSDAHKVSSVTDGSAEADGHSSFSGVIYTIANQHYYGSVFSSTADLFSGASLFIYNSTGTTGTINGPNITINNSTLTEGSLSTGIITATGTVTVKGYSSTAKNVSVASISAAGQAVNTSCAQVAGTINAASVQDGGWAEGVVGYSTFNGNVETTGNQTYFNSSFTSTPNLYSTAGGDISLTNVTGTVGAISASGTSTSTTSVGDVTINNSSLSKTATQTFTTGTIRAVNTAVDPDVYGDVTIMGASATNTVTVSAGTGNISIDYADEVKTSYAVINGTIGGTSGASVKTVTDGGWASGVAGYSTFNNDVTTTGAQTYNNTTFKPGSNQSKALNGSTVAISGADFQATNTDYKFAVFATSASDPTDSHALVIRNSKGSTGRLGTTNSTASMLVDNTDTTEALEIYAVDSHGDATIKGKVADVKNVTIYGIVSANNVKTSNVHVVDSIHDTASIQDGWIEGTEAPYTEIPGNSTFGGSVSVVGLMSFNGSTFSGSPALSSSHAGKISLISCKGSVGAISSTGYKESSDVYVETITINCSASTGTLNAGSVSSFYDADSDGYDAGETCGPVLITSPNNSAYKLVFGSTGDSRFNYTIIGANTFHDGSSNTAGTLVLNGAGGPEIYGSEFNAYGGQYGDAGDSFMIAYPDYTTTAIHGGTFYLNEMSSLLFLSSRVHYSTELPVEFKLGAGVDDETLTSDLIIGKYEPDGFRVNEGKKITFSSSVGSERVLTATATYDVKVYAGTVTFNKVSLSNAAEANTTLQYCSSARGSYKFIDAAVRVGKIAQDLN